MPRSLGTAHLVCVLVLSLLGPRIAVASPGDRDPAFIGCVGTCQHRSCAPWFTHPDLCHPAKACLPADKVSWALRITKWSCEDDCRYLCMLEVERYRRSHGWPSQKYYGKWPFQRILGMQEVASVAFSLLNLLAHVAGITDLWRAVRAAPRTQRGAYPFAWLWTAHSVLHVFCWASSAVFHIRDVRVTERVDYCLAIATVYMGLSVALVRTLSVHTAQGQALVTALTAAALSRHLHHMLYVKFDYSWNIKVCTVVGVSTALVWLVWLALPRPRPGRWVLLVFVLTANVAVLLELLDFPPLLRVPMLADKALQHVAEKAGVKPDDLLIGLVRMARRHWQADDASPHFRV